MEAVEKIFKGLYIFSSPFKLQKIMENVIENKEMAQFLSLIIKKISNDRLNAKEIDSYKSLQLKVDPDNRLESELTNEWKKAEAQSIAERVQEYHNKISGSSFKNPKQYIINKVGKFISFLI